MTIMVDASTTQLRRSARLLSKSTTAFPNFQLAEIGDDPVVLPPGRLNVLDEPEAAEPITESTTLPIMESSVASVHQIPTESKQAPPTTTFSSINIVSVSAVIAVLASVGFALRAMAMQ